MSLISLSETLGSAVNNTPGNTIGSAVARNGLLATLAFVAGFADTLTFVCAHGVFSAHVTGNFVLFAASLAGGAAESDYLKLFTFPAFILSVVVATLLIRKTKWGRDPASLSLLRLEAILLIGCGILFYFTKGVETPLGQVGLMLVVFALGFQNAFHRLTNIQSSPSTVMTGNVTQITVETTDFIFASAPPEKKLREKFKIKEIALSITAFLIGCLTAASLSDVFGLSSLVFSGLMLLFVCGLPSGQNHSRKKHQ